MAEYDPFEGQDALSLPDRPAHPDPSKGVDDLAGYEKSAMHGIVGHHDKKHGLASRAEVEAIQKGEGSPAGNELAQDIAEGKARMIDSTPDNKTVKPKERPGRTATDRPSA
jgi:hypothetical protein